MSKWDELYRLVKETSKIKEDKIFKLIETNGKQSHIMQLQIENNILCRIIWLMEDLTETTNEYKNVR